MTKQQASTRRHIELACSTVSAWIMPPDVFVVTKPQRFPLNGAVRVCEAAYEPARGFDQEKT